MKTDEEKIAVMRAKVDGKGILFCCHDDAWKRLAAPMWNWETFDYMVELEPMVIYKIRIKDNQTLLSSQHYSSAGAEQYGSELGMSDGILEIVKFVEDMSCTTK